ncbi:Hypothetical protein SRAE_2000038000 [Strongyloides ratti]|uniref:Uncharacterized protein n=1 Tax=Strongyloides ratti TaxID=34506 RepID=A0A090MXM7_STRRB|nr:Hypothetical protein SRAE_2000038000 [Strongyloides ratti]CEF65704.1 Hypothetical protein SRAE_2000038000 [Strongyloides ratti]
MNPSVNISNFLSYQHDVIETLLKKYLLKCKTEGGDWELAELGHLLSTIVSNGISIKAFEKLVPILRPKTIDDIKQKYDELLEILKESKDCIPEKWLDTSSNTHFLNEAAKKQLSSSINQFNKLQTLLSKSGKLTQGRRETADAFPFIMEKIAEEDVEDFNIEKGSAFIDSCESDTNINFSLINRQISSLLKGNRTNSLSCSDVAVFTSALDEVISLVDDIDDDVIDKIRLQILRNSEDKTILPLEEFNEENVPNNCVNYFQLTNEFLDSFNIDELLVKLLKND